MLTEILVPISAFALTFGIVYVIFSARNRERMGMIEKGMNPKENFAEKTNSYGILKWALLLLGVGFGIFIGSLIEAYTVIPEEPAYFASALFFGGSGLFAAFLIIKKNTPEV